MPKFEAVFVGFATLDISGRPVPDLPEGGGLAFIDEIRLNPAGTASGAALNAAKLGISSSLVSCIGDDEKGDFVLQACEKLGLDCSLTQRTNRAQTSSTILTIRPNGDRPCLHSRGASDYLFVGDELFDDVCDARFLHYGGTGFIRAMETGQGAKLLQYAKSKGLTTTFDLIAPEEDTVGKLRDLLPYVDYFMPSMEEAAEMSGLKDPGDIAQYFMDLGASNCIFKWGSKGSFIKTSDAEFRIPAYKVIVEDTTGCGDSYCGGFIAGMSMNYGLEDACRLGTATSGLVASGLGSDAGVIDLESTLVFMNTADLLS
ncbi:MAG: sugar kinase [Sneathiella sp.]|uniref:carbohydrate kinase family protein n=1 Tax=Sneathiella sp. TaxID=1964365 RepID=UPI0030014E31